LTVSGFGRRRRPPFSSTVVNQGLFPDVCAKSAKWFHPARDLFRRPGPTKQFPENLNDSSRMLASPPERWPARTGGFDKSAEFLTFLWWKSGSGIRRP
jgi:hypothetical protein